MSRVTSLRDTIKTYYGGATSRRLIGLTNMENDNSATTINDTVLESHVTDIIGRFEMETGITADEDNLSHQTIIRQGVIASLEDAKGRDTGVAKSAESKFVNLLITFKRRAYAGIHSNSKLKPSVEAQNALPDMDRTQNAFVKPPRGRGPQEINNG